jgi:selenide,water dikinase
VKFGLAVTGVVHPERIVRHNTPRVGDALVLTKPLGSGILLTARGRGWVSDEELQTAISVMGALNTAAAELFADFHISASTDVTGFGLAGHLLDMLSGGDAGAEIQYSSLPLLPKAEQWADEGAICGGTKRNMEFYDDKVDYGVGADLASARSVGISTVASSATAGGHKALPYDVAKVVLCDSQTSGGLLVALAPKEAGEFAMRINTALQPSSPAGSNMQWASVIGKVTAGPVGRISVV